MVGLCGRCGHARQTRTLHLPGPRPQVEICHECAVTELYLLACDDDNCCEIANRCRRAEPQYTGGE